MSMNDPNTKKAKNLNADLGFICTPRRIKVKREETSCNRENAMSSKFTPSMKPKSNLKMKPVNSRLYSHERKRRLVTARVKLGQFERRYRQMPISTMQKTARVHFENYIEEDSYAVIGQGVGGYEVLFKCHITPDVIYKEIGNRKFEIRSGTSAYNMEFSTKEEMKKFSECMRTVMSDICTRSQDGADKESDQNESPENSPESRYDIVARESDSICSSLKANPFLDSKASPQLIALEHIKEEARQNILKFKYGQGCPDKLIKYRDFLKSGKSTKNGDLQGARTEASEKFFDSLMNVPSKISLDEKNEMDEFHACEAMFSVDSLAKRSQSMGRHSSSRTPSSETLNEKIEQPDSKMTKEDHSAFLRTATECLRPRCDSEGDNINLNVKHKTAMNVDHNHFREKPPQMTDVNEHPNCIESNKDSGAVNQGSHRSDILDEKLPDGLLVGDVQNLSISKDADESECTAKLVKLMGTLKVPSGTELYSEIMKDLKYSSGLPDKHEVSQSPKSGHANVDIRHPPEYTVNDNKPEEVDRESKLKEGTFHKKGQEVDKILNTNLEQPCNPCSVDKNPISRQAWGEKDRTTFDNCVKVNEDENKTQDKQMITNESNFSKNDQNTDHAIKVEQKCTILCKKQIGDAKNTSKQSSTEHDTISPITVKKPTSRMSEVGTLFKELRHKQQELRDRLAEEKTLRQKIVEEMKQRAPLTTDGNSLIRIDSILRCIEEGEKLEHNQLFTKCNQEGKEGKVKSNGDVRKPSDKSSTEDDSRKISAPLILSKASDTALPSESVYFTDSLESADPDRGETPGTSLLNQMPDMPHLAKVCHKLKERIDHHQNIHNSQDGTTGWQPNVLENCREGEILKTHPTTNPWCFKESNDEIQNNALTKKALNHLYESCQRPCVKKHSEKISKQKAQCRMVDHAEEIVVDATIMVFLHESKKWIPCSKSKSVSKLSIKHDILNDSYCVEASTDRELVITRKISCNQDYEEIDETFHCWGDDVEMIGFHFTRAEDAKRFSACFAQINHRIRRKNVSGPQDIKNQLHCSSRKTKAKVVTGTKKVSKNTMEERMKPRRKAVYYKVDNSGDRQGDGFVVDEQALQSIISNAGISEAQTLSSQSLKRHTLASGFKQPGATLNPAFRKSVYTTGSQQFQTTPMRVESSRRGTMSSARRKPVPMSMAGSQNNPMLSPKNSILVEEPIRQSIYKEYVRRPVDDGSQTPVTPKYLPRRVLVSGKGEPRRVLVSGKGEQPVVKDTVKTKLTFNEEEEALDQEVKHYNLQAEFRKKKILEKAFGAYKSDSEEAGAGQSLQASLREDDKLALKVKSLELAEASKKQTPVGKSTKNSKALQPLSPNIVGLKNSPQLKPAKSVKFEMDSLKTENKLAVYSAQVGKENMSPCDSPCAPSPPDAAIVALNQTLDESMLEYEQLESVAHKLKVMHNDGDILKQLDLIEQKKAELEMLQSSLKRQLKKQEISARSKKCTKPLQKSRKGNPCLNTNKGTTPKRNTPKSTKTSNSSGSPYSPLMREVIMRNSSSVHTPSSPYGTGRNNPLGGELLKTTPERKLLCMPTPVKFVSVEDPVDCDLTFEKSVPILTPLALKSALERREDVVKPKPLLKSKSSDNSIAKSDELNECQIKEKENIKLKPDKPCQLPPAVEPYQNFPSSSRIQDAATISKPESHAEPPCPTSCETCLASTVTNTVNSTSMITSTSPAQPKPGSSAKKSPVNSHGSLSLRGNMLKPLVVNHKKNDVYKPLSVDVSGKIPYPSAEFPKGLGPALLMVTANRYREALLDNEVTLYMSRIHESDCDVKTTSKDRYRDPVSFILNEGDDMHFRPIACEDNSTLAAENIEGSAFGLVRQI